MPITEAVRNWRLLEREIINALRHQGLKVEKNIVGDPCVSELNIATLAQALSASGVFVDVTGASVKR